MTYKGQEVQAEREGTGFRVTVLNNGESFYLPAHRAHMLKKSRTEKELELVQEELKPAFIDYLKSVEFVIGSIASPDKAEEYHVGPYFWLRDENKTPHSQEYPIFYPVPPAEVPEPEFAHATHDRPEVRTITRVRVGRYLLSLGFKVGVNEPAVA